MHQARRSSTNEEHYLHRNTVLLGQYGAYRGGTIFVRVENDFRAYLGASLCSWHDQFCRRLGRTYARRLYMTAKQRGACMPTIFAADFTPVDWRLLYDLDDTSFVIKCEEIINVLKGRRTTGGGTAAGLPRFAGADASATGAAAVPNVAASWPLRSVAGEGGGGQAG